MKDYTDAINETVKELGNIAFRHAKKHCPVVTGNLKRSITLSEIHDRPKGIMYMSVWTDVSYAKDVEFGWERRRPKPFLGNAIEYARTQVFTEFEKIFKGSVGK